MQATTFCGRYHFVAVFVRTGYELIGIRIDEIKFLHIHISTYCTVSTLHSWHVFLLYFDVQVQICCLMIFVSIFTNFLVLLWVDDGPS